MTPFSVDTTGKALKIWFGRKASPIKSGGMPSFRFLLSLFQFKHPKLYYLCCHRMGKTCGGLSMRFEHHKTTLSWEQSSRRCYLPRCAVITRLMSLSLELPHSSSLAALDRSIRSCLHCSVNGNPATIFLVTFARSIPQFQFNFCI